MTHPQFPIVRLACGAIFALTLRASTVSGQEKRHPLLDRLRGVSSQEDAPSETDTVAGLKVAVWRPPGGGQKSPVILFSHGFGGCSTQSKFLLGALARKGYLVVAPDHRDARCGKGAFAAPAEPFRQPIRWTDKTYDDRGADLRSLLASLKTSPVWAEAGDWRRVGLIGHSLGGYTVLALAGAWPSWKLPGVKAVLALSPYCAPLAAKGALDMLGVPTMYQGGTRDVGISPSITKNAGCFEKTAAPAYYVELDGAGHFAWTDLNPKFHRQIVDISAEFLDRYVKGDGDGASRLGKPPGLAGFAVK